MIDWHPFFMDLSYGWVVGSGATSLGCKQANKTLFLKIHRCCHGGHASYKNPEKTVKKWADWIVLYIKNADLLRLPKQEGV